jgi:hypothetical protein
MGHSRCVHEIGDADPLETLFAKKTRRGLDDPRAINLRLLPGDPHASRRNLR